MFKFPVRKRLHTVREKIVSFPDLGSIFLFWLGYENDQAIERATSFPAVGSREMQVRRMLHTRMSSAKIGHQDISQKNGSETKTFCDLSNIIVLRCTIIMLGSQKLRLCIKGN